MTRSVKDLRELICVSRLTMRDSDEDEEDLSRPLSSLSIFGEPSTASGASQVADNINGLSITPKPPEEGKEARSRLQQGTGARRKQPSANKRININNNASIDFKKFKIPLPPLESRPSSGSSVDSERLGSGEVGGQDNQCGNFDDILQYIDSDVIVDWLGRANAMVCDLSSWCNSGENFIMFANFMLMDFPEIQRLELIQMEVGILHDELSLVFDKGLKQGKVKPTDVSRLISAILREYPERLCSPRATHIFLNILDILSSERTEEYKKLLTDVKMSTRNSGYAQSMLAMRAFLLLSVWSNIVNFYRRFKSNDFLSNSCVSSDLSEAQSSASTMQQRAYQAVQHGFVSVVHYLLQSGKLDVASVDKEDRSLVFEAVMYNQPRVLHFLLDKAHPDLNVNLPCESGNTPLHAAANWGFPEVVHMLLDKGHALVNATNSKCDDATPLHLAVMQGHTAICKLLLEAGADTAASMNGITPAQLAEDMGHTDILALLTRSQTYDYVEEVDEEDSYDKMMEL